MDVSSISDRAVLVTKTGIHLADVGSQMLSDRGKLLPRCSNNANSIKEAKMNFENKSHPKRRNSNITSATTPTFLSLLDIAPLTNPVVYSPVLKNQLENHDLLPTHQHAWFSGRHLYRTFCLFN
jgi:hypothetical protein